MIQVGDTLPAGTLQEYIEVEGGGITRLAVLDDGVGMTEEDAVMEGLLKVDRDFETTVPGVYAAGDITPGTRLAIRAAYEGTRASIGIHKSLIPEERKIGLSLKRAQWAQEEQTREVERALVAPCVPVGASLALPRLLVDVALPPGPAVELDGEPQPVRDLVELGVAELAIR